jgi:hypothetical protein
MKNSVRFQRTPLFLLLTLFLLPTASQPAQAQDGPTIPMDSVRVRALNIEKDNRDYRNSVPGWVPTVQFRVIGPIAEGSQLWVEYKLPGNRKWLEYDCPGIQIPAANEQGRWDAYCGPNGVMADKHVTIVGTIEFAIHLRNELAGTNATLFTGKAKIWKLTKDKKSTLDDQYDVNEDWRIPIGYVFLDSDLYSTMWFVGGKGGLGALEAYLFYQGKNVAKAEGGCCGPSELPSEAAGIPGHEPRWRVFGKAWQFRTVFQSKTGRYQQGTSHLLSENPGEYEIKVLAGGRLARSMKFTVAEDGTIADNGIATALKLGSNRIIVPVKVIGDQDGEWERAEWKTGAFYGHPLTGFTPEP